MIVIKLLQRIGIEPFLSKTRAFWGDQLLESECNQLFTLFQTPQESGLISEPMSLVVQGIGQALSRFQQQGI
jgi:hypothetical protein